MIPKIVHYCWLSNDPVPENLKEYMYSWKKILPDYQFVKWDFSKFEKSSSIWVSEAFDNKKYALACDYIRLYALYNNGGIYMDMDIEVLQSFNSLLDKKYMIAKEHPDRQWIEAGCFGAEKGDPFLAKCLEYYKNKHFVNEHGVFEDAPLPKIMAKVYEENNFTFELYNWHAFTNKSYDTGEISTNADSFAIHHFAGSWKSEEERMVKKRAVDMRKSIPVIGSALAFMYQKIFYTKEALKKGGLQELTIQVKRYINKL